MNLIQIVNNLKTDIINSMQAKGSIPSDQTIQQITVTDNGDNVQLQVPGYLLILEQGRGPTSKNPVPGNPPMIQRIQQWCQAKGIPATAAWAIKKKIDKLGYPAKPGILTQPLGDDNINQRVNEALPQIADDLTTEILNALSL